MTPGPYLLPPGHFQALATGGGDAETLAALRGGQLSKHTLLIRAVLDQAAATVPGEHQAAHLEHAYRLLAAVQHRSPGVVERLLLHPNVGAWAVHCLRRLHGQPTPGTPLRADLGYLAAVAASAALRAGASFQIEVPATDGMVMLPSLGAVTIQAAEQCANATLSGDGAQARIACGDGAPLAFRYASWPSGPGWLGLRRMAATADGLDIDVELDDIDPCRGYVYPSVAGRLDDAAAAQWRALFSQAWAVLVRQHRPYAVAVAAGLRSLVPQSSPDPLRSVSATSTDAFGSVALSRPADPVAFALTLVHEFQHAKLGALLDLVPLYRPRSEVRYYAPWRDDPRPLGGLLQGVYAFLGVTDFWRIQRHQPATRTDASLAHFEFARWREQTRRAVEELSASPELTDRGRDLVAGLRARLTSWDGEPVPAALAEQARDSALDHRARWRVRNLRPDPGQVAALSRAWLAGEPPPEHTARRAVVSGCTAPPVDSIRLRLWHLGLTAPDRFARLCAGQRADPDFAAISAADIAFAQGDYLRAAQLYREQFDRAPGVDPLIGLALSLLRDGDAGRAAALLAQPELLCAVHVLAREANDYVDPESLANWLDRSAVHAGKDTA